MKDPEIYTHHNSSFGKGPYKRLEIDITDEPHFFSINELDDVIKKHFPEVTRDKVYFGLHYRGCPGGRYARTQTLLAIQAAGEFE